MTFRHAWLGVALAALSAGAAACGPEAKVPAEASVREMRIATPLLVFDRSGSIDRVDLSTGARTTLVVHDFAALDSLRQSPDGRWIGYSGAAEATGPRSYWLFDTRTGTDRRIVESPFGSPAFSPDSRRLVVPAFERANEAAPERRGFELFDLADGTSAWIEHPSARASSESGFFLMASWSAGADELLLHAIVPGEKRRDLYHAYHVADSRFEAVRGDQDRVGLDRFRRGGVVIPTVDDDRIHSHIQRYDMRSADGRWAAHVDPKSHVLSVTGADGVLMQVATGDYNFCEGVTIGIHDWIDDAHLVYRLSGVTYVFEPQTRAIARLFADGEAAYDFTW